MPCLALSALMPAMKPGPRDAHGHGLRLVAVHARDRMLDQGPALSSFMSRASAYGMPGDHLEALRDVALAGEAVQGEIRGVAVQARARLLPLGHPPGLLLVEERVGVPATVAVVEREGVAGEDALEPGVPVELLLGGARVARSGPAAAVLGGGGERGPEIAIVLVRPVLAPRASGPSSPRSPRPRARRADGPPACARRCW